VEISSDFKELLQAFDAANVKYLIVGAHAVGYHGHPRGTGDFDVWVERSQQNAESIYRALASFGAPLTDVTAADFTSDDLIYQIGVQPIRIDVITSISGVEFDDAWPNRAQASSETSAHPAGTRISRTLKNCSRARNYYAPASKDGCDAVILG